MERIFISSLARGEMSDIRDAAVDLHARGHRVPQEALDRAVLAQVLRPCGENACS